MSQNPFSAKVRIYVRSAILLITAAILLRAVNFIFIFDTAVDYFNPHPLHYLYLTLCVLSVIWFLTAPIVIPKYAFPIRVTFPASRASHIAAWACVGLTVAAFFFFRESMLYYPASAVIYNQLAIFSLFSIIYFALHAIGNPAKEINALSAYLVIIWICLMLSVTYIDLFVAMNSPFKITLHMALMSMLLFVLEDARRQTSNRHFRIMYLSAALIAALHCGVASFPVLLAFALKKYFVIDYFFYAMLMAGFFFFICLRAYDCYRVLMVSPVATKEEISEEERRLKEEKAKKNKKKGNKSKKSADAGDQTEKKGEDTHVS